MQDSTPRPLPAPHEAPPRPPEDVRHSWLDDLMALLVGTILASLGLVILEGGGLVSGGTAGISLLLAHATPLSVGVLFLVVNVPFFVLAVRGKGWMFSIRSAVAMLLVSAMYALQVRFIDVDGIDPVYAAVVGSTVASAGLLVLFRHHASLGGFNVVALYLQDRRGWRAGYVLMVLDASILACSLLVIEPMAVLVSLAGTILLDLVLALNHRPGRYAGA